jgi:transcriptional regulator with XRE-family HTH domain
MKTPYDFGMTLKQLRKARGLSQRQLAEMVYVTDSMISKYEANGSIPSLETVQRMALVFNVSMDYLCGMEKTINISTVQLTPEQIQITRDLVELFRNKQNLVPRKLSTVRHSIIGRIAIELEK